MLTQWALQGQRLTRSSCSVGTDLKYWSNAISHCKLTTQLGSSQYADRTRGISYPDKKHEDEYVRV